MSEVEPELLAVGAAVRRIRKSRDLSQERLATLAGLHRNYIGYVERGERKLTVVTLVQLARALKVRPAELLADVD